MGPGKLSELNIQNLNQNNPIFLTSDSLFVVSLCHSYLVDIVNILVMLLAFQNVRIWSCIHPGTRKRVSWMECKHPKSFPIQWNTVVVACKFKIKAISCTM